MSSILVPNRFPPQMVRRPTYYEEQPPPTRRYSSRSHEYAISDRDLRPASTHNFYTTRGQYVGNQDSRNNNHSPDQDEAPRTRSRIPVACGRCRKRKIRCSGDNGGPCTNCKSAGHDQCQFLRVSSTETTMIKNESPVFDFDHGNASSRINCHLVPCGPHFHTTQTPPLNLNSYPSLRNNSLSSYQFPVKQPYTLPNYGEFGEDNVDYGLTYTLATASFPGDPMGIGANCTSAPSRTWVPTPQLKNMPFLDQPTPVYSHGQLSYGTTNYDARSNISPESKPPQLTIIPQTLPIQVLPTPLVTGTDRLLPVPAPVPVNRPAQYNQYFSSTDGLLPRTHAGSYIDYSSPQTLKSDSSNGSVNGNSTQSTPENSNLSTTIYTPVATQSPESLNSAQAAYSSSSFSLPASQQQHVYTPPQSSYSGMQNTNEVPASYNNSSINNGDNSNISSERRGSHASHKSSTVSSEGLLNANEASGSYNHSSSNDGGNNDEASYERRDSQASYKGLSVNSHGLLDGNDVTNSYNPNSGNKNDSYTSCERRGSQANYKNSSASNYHGLLTPGESPGSYNHTVNSNTFSERRSSQASYQPSSVNNQGGYHPDGLPAVTNATLVNGYQYHPASSSNQYPAPSIDIQPQPRRASGVLA